jgi:hypothetical protein
VSEEIIDCDIRNISFIRSLAIVCAECPGRAEDLVAEIELACLDKREDRNCGDRLGQVGDAKERVLLCLHHLLTVSHSARVIIDKATALRDRDRHRGHAKLLLEALSVLAQAAALLAGSPEPCLGQRIQRWRADCRARSGPKQVGDYISAVVSVTYHTRSLRFHRSDLLRALSLKRSGASAIVKGSIEGLALDNAAHSWAVDSSTKDEHVIRLRPNDEMLHVNGAFYSTGLVRPFEMPLDRRTLLRQIKIFRRRASVGVVAVQHPLSRDYGRRRLGWRLLRPSNPSHCH